MTTVFEVAGSLLQHAQNEALSPLKLQKLAFYTFGWYGHLTSERLFDEPFYAMEYGPVVSPLLSVHKGRSAVSKTALEDTLQRELKVQDDYVAEVVDAIWQSYGAYSHGELIEMTHCETPWEVAWYKNRPTYARRSDLDADTIVEHFRKKTTSTYVLHGRVVDVPVLSLLPDRRKTFVSEVALRSMENCESHIPSAHITRAAELRRKFLISA